MVASNVILIFRLAHLATSASGRLLITKVGYFRRAPPLDGLLGILYDDGMWELKMTWTFVMSFSGKKYKLNQISLTSDLTTPSVLNMNQSQL